jgi:tetratricopeptide (TPR) repeat protein
LAEPENVAYRDSLGWALFRLGRYSESVAELRRAVNSEHPDAIILEHLGDALHAQGNPTEAIETWTKALKLLSEGTDAHLKRIESKIRPVDGD